MAPPYNRISTAELELFLDDVHKNIAHDDDTDFRKLALYLLGFTNSKLEALHHASPSEYPLLLALAARLVAAIELVLSKRKHVLNMELSPDEIALLLLDLHRVVSPPTSPVLVYDWTVSFACLWLPQFPADLEATNVVKSFLIELINIVAVHLHAVKYKQHLRTMLLRSLATKMDMLFEYLPLISLKDDFAAVYAPLLSSSVHLFTVVNDFDIAAKLNLQNNQLRFEGYAKKIAFVFSSIDLVSLGVDPTDAIFKLFDSSKSILLLNLTANIVLDPAVKWALVALALKCIHEHFYSYQKGHTHQSSMKSYNKVCCSSLMKIFVFCRQNSLLPNFYSSFPMHNFALLLGPNETSHFPPSILKLLHLLQFQATLTHDTIETNELTGKLTLASVPFTDNELNDWRGKVLDENTNSLSSILQFIVDSPHSYERYVAQLSHDHNGSEVSKWLTYVVNLFQHSQVFGNRESFYTFLTSLRKVPCLIAGDFDYDEDQCLKCSTLSKKNIYEDISPKRKEISELHEALMLYNTIICDFLLKRNLQVLRKDPLLATNLLLALFNLLATFKYPIGDVQSDPLLRFILDCLKNSNRNVRILAARTLPLLLITETDTSAESLFKRIFLTVSGTRFDAESGCLHLAESTLLALAELAIISNGEWLCVIFIKLIDSLGEPNEQHVNIAYDCLLYVASARSSTPYKLLSPYLPSIAERIIKKPRMFVRLTELLGISQKYFLSNTREYTAPRFLEYYKHDYIKDIAEASRMDKLKLITKTLPRIMATYLCKDDEIDAKYIVNVLSNASPSYKRVTMSDLIPNVGEVLWFILLQMQMDDEGNIHNERKIYRAIVYVAKINWLKRQDGNDLQPPDENEFNYIKYILAEHVLELAQRFSENVHQMKGIKPYLEKVSSIKAIQFLITQNTDAAAWALGQISTCLQAALDNSSLEFHAIQCWNVLIQKLDAHHLVSLFDITISLIFQKFTTFSHRSKLIAAEILEKLFQVLRDKYNKYALYFFLVPFIKDLDKYYVLDPTFISMMKPKSKLSYFGEFTRRLQTSNKFVVHQSLDDLLNFINKYQHSCQEEDFRDSANEQTISELIRILLDTSVQFKSKDPSISTKCAKVLSSIGALDSNRFNFKSMNLQIIMLFDFQDYRENASFIVHFIQDKVIKNFWASNDPIRQLFSVYSMQSFLSVLGLDPSILGPTSQGVRTEIWNSFSEIDKSTLTPLLSSRYFAQNPRYEPMTFPHYRLGMKYEKWLVDIATNLFRRPGHNSMKLKGGGSAAKAIIFQTCSMLIRDEEVSISQYLLKYVALSHIVNGDDEARADILKEFLSILNTDASTNAASERVENLKFCYQSVFEVIDYFNEWVSAATQKLSDTLLPKTEASTLKRCRGLVLSFLEEIPMELIAVASSKCDSYERTILYLEKCYRNGKVQSGDKLDDLNIATTLQTVYSSIDDFDALDGVLKKFSTSNLAEKLDTFQYNENWFIAQESFQALRETGNEEERVQYNTKLLKSYADHALYDKVLSSLDSKIDSDSISRLPVAWAMVGLQASLVSGDPGNIKKWHTIVDTIGRPQDVEDVVSSQYAKGILSLVDSKRAGFDTAVGEIYSLIGQSLSLSTSSSFSRNTALMTQLHFIFDTTLAVSVVHDDDSLLAHELDVILKKRLNNTDLAFDRQWQILSMHKLVNVVTNNVDAISENYLSSSRMARREKRLDISTKCIMNAMVLNDHKANIEYAHLLWDQGKQTEAIKTLSENLPKGSGRSARSIASTQLQYALWLDESSHSSSSTIIAEYTKAYKHDPTWDKSYFDLGKYYSKIMESQDDTSGFYEQQIIRLYLKALALGPSYIFEALPKLITIWLDFSQRPSKSREAQRKLVQIMHDIQTYRTSMPVYVWFTCITQLLSRITHSHQPSADLILQIIELLITTYPKHSLWYVLSHVKSKDLQRKERVAKILTSVQQEKNLGLSILNAKELFDILESLASQKVKKNTKKKWFLSEDFNVKDTKKRYNSLVIPVKSNLEIRIPASRHTSNGMAFPKSATITFDGFDEEVNIFSSLQMPKQITIRGTDNKPYRLMVKRDDTRKDAKVFEFTNMINRLLASNPDARKRNLVIENYSVIPLAEDMGVIEFVQDVATMKSVIQFQQKKAGIVSNDRKVFMKIDEAQKVVKAKYPAEPADLEALMSLYNKICEELSPVLHQWFIQQFSDPAVWYMARKNYTRTSAVMSIVGYVIGLGDRHCENILFFKKNGATLHIDFDCLFEKGATLPTPEIVPFRLTQNMVDAMGITGIEGTFRITCEVTGTLVRENEASLMNILETLIYDPLLDWKTLDKPQEHLRKVRRKIRGLLDEKEGLPMNIHGQVDVLLQEATSVENLSQMYAGWAAWQ